ncbi:MAG: hypothetical protein H0X37_15325 [Herpetosiphonaceae bacterium]|nr:hypothetical protein [Herpetosiphonaceae bacterium]
MRVRFLVDFRGVLTNEQFFLAGTEAEFDVETAKVLVAEGRAELVDQDVSQRGKGR